MKAWGRKKRGLYPNWATFLCALSSPGFLYNNWWYLRKPKLDHAIILLKILLWLLIVLKSLTRFQTFSTINKAVHDVTTADLLSIISCCYAISWIVFSKYKFFPKKTTTKNHPFHPKFQFLPTPIVSTSGPLCLWFPFLGMFFTTTLTNSPSTSLLSQLQLIV